MISDKEYNSISEDAYYVDSTKEKGKEPIIKGSLVAEDKFIVIEPPVDATNGMQAMAVAPIVDGEPDLSHIVIAYAGTNSSDIRDLWADITAIGLGDTGNIIPSSEPFTNGLTSQAFSALAFATMIEEKYPNSVITTTGHSLGESLGLYVALKKGYLNTGFNGPDIASLITDEEKEYMRLHPYQFINYRNYNDAIGGITGNMTKTAVYIDYGSDLSKSHNLKLWQFNKNNQVIDGKGQVATDNIYYREALVDVSTLSIYKRLLSAHGYTKNEEIFLDSQNASLLAKNLTNITNQAVKEVKGFRNQAVSKAEKIWDETSQVPFGFILSPFEVRDAYAEGGVTYSSVVETTRTHFDEKLKKSEDIDQVIENIKTSIQNGIEEKISHDEQLAKDFTKWTNMT
ncbi:hypothetical protein [Streptococcus marimammalium]|uniref:hypothetical protein n=1 Tax=Streptococcus marimammalium TaxID=269666 RepID=UPI000379A49E|nr:hypothetical protein [Streptococcus marimammalium]